MSEPTQAKRLYRSKTNKVIAGVCGGLGEYFNVDPVVIRIGVVIFTLAGGAGVLGYLIGWLVIPEAPGTASTPPSNPIA